MNHVPNEVLESLDAFGEGLLLGEVQPVDCRLRSDLRIAIRPGESECGDTAVARFEIEHTRAPPTIRAYGSFVTTVVDNVEARLRSWGVDPPDAYEYAGAAAGTKRYEGELGLP